MEFSHYQAEALKTLQPNNSSPENSEMVPFLGIIGEVGSVVTQLKIKLRAGNSYIAFERKLTEELGDVLWYISTIASQYKIDLENVAAKNLQKTSDRFLVEDATGDRNFDENYPDSEKFPEEFEIEFKSYKDDGKNKTKIIDKRDGSMIGDPLTDNNYVEDGYRYHDIFHYGYLAVLGWSPVVRKLLQVKRRSDKMVDENEDGARAQITEEVISLYIFQHALEHNLLKYGTSVDSGLIKQVQNLVVNTEVKDCSGKQWEKAILASYKVFNELVSNNGGRVMVSRKNKSLIYLGTK